MWPAEPNDNAGHIGTGKPGDTRRVRFSEPLDTSLPPARRLLPPFPLPLRDESLGAMTSAPGKDSAMTLIHALPTIRELAHRQADGIEVRLLWDSADNALSVVVADSRTGDYFRLALDERDRALDVFEHPYAYAANRGLDFQLPARKAEPALAA
jgi:YD repeat-containing protein